MRLSILRLALTASLFLSSMFVVSPASANGCGASSGGPFDGGDGLSASPFLVSTAAQLQSIETNACLVTGYHFKLTSDISLAGLSWTPVGTSSEFTNGSFDGDFHTISGLTVSGAKAGLFGTLNGMTIKNLKIKDSTVAATSGDAGVVAHTVKGTTSITQVEIDGATITANNGSAGGIIPRVDAGVTLSITKVSVAGSVGATYHVGGIVGEIRGTTISDAVFSGSLQSTSGRVGGLVGYGSGTNSITKGYSTGTVSGGAYRGGTVGQVGSSPSPFTSTYFLAQDGLNSPSDGVSKTTLELQTIGTFAAPWSITNDLSAMRAATATETWFIDPDINGGLPILSWQYFNGSFECSPGRYSVDGNQPCNVAPVGKFVATYGATVATDCPAGTFAENEQSVACTQAPVGYYVAQAGSSASVVCPVGRYQPFEGATACLVADPGRFVDVTGASSQILCPVGTYQPNAGSYECVIADPGYFVASVGSVVQTVCAPGFVSEALASSCYKAASSARPYTGPSSIIVSKSAPANGTGFATGDNLGSIDAVFVGGIQTTFEVTEEGTLTFAIPEIVPGNYAVKFFISENSVYLTSYVDIVAGVRAVANDAARVNAGSFKGYVALYAKGYEGKRLSAKVGKDWVIIPSIPAATNDLYRVVEYTGAGVDVAVKIYIDRVLRETVDLTTR
ncbi:MAG: hypothetical protein K9G13_06545 [Aquiluna sp.]|nr:hypothetical protein [Aquiluna sp.]MCF8546175.1 hypothetical protein [Aquiluna sp.]